MNSAEDRVHEALRIIKGRKDTDDISLLVDTITKLMDNIDPQLFVLLWRLLNDKGNFNHLKDK